MCYDSVLQLFVLFSPSLPSSTGLNEHVPWTGGLVGRRDYLERRPYPNKTRQVLPLGIGVH